MLNSSNYSIANVIGYNSVLAVKPGTATIFCYDFMTGCASSKSVTVTPTAKVKPITGIQIGCVGSPFTVSDAVTGGVWNSSNTACMTINSSGVITPVKSDGTIISYRVPTGETCEVGTYVSYIKPITGPTTACVGDTITLASEAEGDGSDIFWPTGYFSSADTSIANPFNYMFLPTDASLIKCKSAGNVVITFTGYNGGRCSTTTTLTVNGKPVVSSISGVTAMCVGTTDLMTDSISGGTWSSANTAIASINAITGLVTSIMPGTTTILYTVSNTCGTTTVTKTLTVDTALTVIGTITGPHAICDATLATLSNATTGGTWSNTGFAIITDTLTGDIYGIVVGTATVTYMIKNACGSKYAITTVTVLPIPTPILGTYSLCAGSSATLSDGSTGGTWTSTNTSVAAITPATGIITGYGAGTASISYTLTNGCSTRRIMTIAPTAAAISGATTVCNGMTTTLSDAIPGGFWLSSDIAIAPIGISSGTIIGSGSGTATITYAVSGMCSALTTVTIFPIPTIITGPTTVCSGDNITMSDGISGGTWTCGNTSIAKISPSTGVVTGISGGTGSINYTLANGCFATYTLTVVPNAMAISGATTVCSGMTTTLSDVSPGGFWLSGDIAVAPIGISSGIISASASGTATITYAVSGMCSAMTTVTVHPTPASITGASNVCQGNFITITDSDPGGTWSTGSTNIIIAGSITTTISGITPGTSAITYTLPTGCTTTMIITVDTIPSLITGTLTACAGATTTLYNAIAGGTWISGDATIALIDTATGIATGVSAGMIPATYILTNGCLTTTTLTINPLPVITGPGYLCLTDTVTFHSIGGGIWNCSDTAIATIDASTGLTTGKSTGSATITYIAGTSCRASSFISVDSLHIPLVSIVSAGDTICPGSYILLGAKGTNEGTAPHYQWSINGVNAGSDTLAYYYIPTDGDIVKVLMTSNEHCALPDTASANKTLTVLSTPLPYITFTINPGITIYAGQSDTLTANVVNGGSSPNYQWLINNNIVPGATTSVFICDSFKNNDSVTCAAENSGVCVYETFNGVIIHVNPLSIVNETPASIFTLYPNPNQGSFNLTASCQELMNENMTVRITNIAGQTLYTDSIKPHNGTINQPIALNNAATGLYLLILKSQHVNKVLRFTIE